MAFTPKQAMEIVNSPSNVDRIQKDFLRYSVYQGQLRAELLTQIKKEFLLQKTIDGLSHRIVPINIVQKIVNKLAMVYRQAPSRKPVEENAKDMELLDTTVKSFSLNQKGKWANRYFKLLKNAAWEPFVDRDGVPRLRTLPSHTFTPLSDDPVQPERPTGMVKHVIPTGDKKDQRHHYWTDANFWILDGDGKIVIDEMFAMDNEDNLNPFGKIPMVYIAESDDGNLIPISDDDLISMQFVIGALLTDLTYASKFQAWSIFVLTGVDTSEDVELNPSSVVKLPPDATLSAIKPEIDIDQMLNQVEMLVGLLLTTKNLSVGDITGSVTSTSSASGVAMMIDRSETTEDRMDQEAFFVDAEQRLMDLWAHKMLPILVASGKLDPEFEGAFSADFKLAITFPDQKPFVSDKELIETEIIKLQNKLTTKKAALEVIFPDLNDDQIDKLIASIEKEGLSSIARFMESAQEKSDQPVEDKEDGDIQGPGQDTEAN